MASFQVNYGNNLIKLFLYISLVGISWWDFTTKDFFIYFVNPNCNPNYASTSSPLHQWTYLFSPRYKCTIRICQARGRAPKWWKGITSSKLGNLGPRNPHRWGTIAWVQYRNPGFTFFTLLPPEVLLAHHQLDEPHLRDRCPDHTSRR